MHCVLLALAAGGYCLYIISGWSLAYIDFGDGNYLYIGRRIAEGAVAYRDILAPQPPCHLFLGALLWRVADLLPLHEPIYFFRAFSLLLQLASFLLVVRLAWRAWGRAGVAVAAGAIYLWLPIGTWWSLGYQSEPLETFFLLCMAVAALRDTRAGDVAAGLAAALATLTNATSWPFLAVVLLYSVFHLRRRLIWWLVPWAVVVGTVTVVLHIWTDGAFLANVILNQVDTYPDSWGERFVYGLSKILGQGTSVLIQEGFFVFAALLGLVRFLRDSPLAPGVRGALGWYLLATIGSIIYVSKGGTMDYIFSLGEPAVAILAAGELAAWARRWFRVEAAGLPGWRVGRVDGMLLKCVGTAALLLFATLHGLTFYRAIRLERPFELGELRTDRLVRLIERHSTPDDVILAPPFYAVRARRPIWGDYSELFIWIMKYRHDVSAWPPNPEGEGWAKIRAMAEALERREPSIVVLEMDQTGVAPDVMLTLRRFYRPLSGFWNQARNEYLFQTRNTRLGIFLPLEPGETAETHDEEWDAFLDELMNTYGVRGVAERFPWYDAMSGGTSETLPAGAED